MKAALDEMRTGARLPIGLLICLALAGPAVRTSGQAVEAAMTEPGWKLEHLLPEDGLSSATVYAVLQDRTGFLWIATEGGLNRYDGHRFRVFNHDPNDPSSLASDDISFMLEDSEGMLWLATWGGGLDRFDPATETIHNFRVDPEGRPRATDGLADDRIQHIFEDSSGTLWIGTFSGGLARFDRETGGFESFRHDPAEPTSLCHDRVWRIAEDPSGSLWIATGRGLCWFDPAAGTFERFRHVPGDPASLSDDVVRTLWVDSHGVLWVGTASGLDRFDRLRKTFERFPPTPEGLSHGVITALFEDSRGNFWVGTRGGGLNILDRASGRWQRLRHDPGDPASLSDDDVRALFEDRSGVLWIATRQGGLNKLDLKPAKFEWVEATDKGLGNGRIRAFAEDARGRLWIGTAEGVERWDPDQQRFDRVGPHEGIPASPPPRSGASGALPANDVHQMLIDRSGDLWVAGGGNGLHRLASAGAGSTTFRHDPDDPQSLADDMVTALFEDRSGALWIGTLSGLDRLDIAATGRAAAGRAATGHDLPAFEHFRFGVGGDGSPGKDFVTALSEDSGGGLWIGTHNHGLQRLEVSTGRFEQFASDLQNPASLSNNRITVIFQQAGREKSERGLWIGTTSGLNELLPEGSFRRYLEADGLPHPQIAGILGDDQGLLWVATGDGLSRLDPRTGAIRNYTSGDGLQTGPFNVGASIRRRDGRLCFGGNNGYNCFRPAEVADNPHPPTVVLTGFEKLGKSVRFDRAFWAVEDIRLSHEDTFFAFEFAALDYTSPEDNGYRYMLEGFDRDWIDAGPQRSASYSNVAPGAYVFRVRGANSDAVWNETDLAVDLSITPPFWKTTWFRLLTALSIMAIGGAAYSFRITALKQREQILGQRVEEGLADLRRSEERYRLLFERNLAGVVRATIGGRVVECNPAFARILGYESPQECQDQHHLDLDEATPHLSLLARLRQSGTVVGHEAEARTRDGSMVSLLWNANLVDGTEGEPVVEGTVIDVSERQRIEEGLRRAQKLESLGVLAGGIAHDFNNLLMSIQGNAELGRMDADPDAKVQRRLEQIEIATQRAAELAKQMLAYSGKGEFVVTRLDLSKAVRGMADLLEGAVPKKARVVYRLSEDLPEVEADAGQVEQIIMSLVTNASEALGGTGTITIASGSRHYDPEDLAETYLDDRLPANRYVYLEVADDGCGMDEELQRKIFDPFFTTKFTGRGLGLAAVLGIVRGHRGAIKIDSAPGRGSTFTVLFPAAPERPQRAAAAVPDEAPLPDRGTVLVVDDDAAVRQVAQNMVEALGFDVVTANDGRQGLEIFRRRSDEIALVILDLAMPRMSGEEAFREIRSTSPGARVILASGYDERESTRLFAGQGLSGFIQKPYRLSSLKEKIQQALGTQE